LHPIQIIHSMSGECWRIDVSNSSISYRASYWPPAPPEKEPRANNTRSPPSRHNRGVMSSGFIRRGGAFLFSGFSPAFLRFSFPFLFLFFSFSPPFLWILKRRKVYEKYKKSEEKEKKRKEKKSIRKV